MRSYKKLIIKEKNKKLERFRVLQGLLCHITQEEFFGGYPHLIGRLEEVEREVELQILRLGRSSVREHSG